MPHTNNTSKSVGSTLKSMKLKRNWMPLVPRSMTRDRPPVWRSTWKRSARPCRCLKVESATERMACWPTLANSASRSSPNAWDSTRTPP